MFSFQILSFEPVFFITSLFPMGNIAPLVFMNMFTRAKKCCFPFVLYSISLLILKDFRQAILSNLFSSSNHLSKVLGCCSNFRQVRCLLLSRKKRMFFPSIRKLHRRSLSYIVKITSIIDQWSTVT